MIARTLALGLLAFALCRGADWQLETLYTRPFVWGTVPESLSWAKKAPALVFLWNEEGRRFLDLYCWNAQGKTRIRVTALEDKTDPYNPTPDEKDERLRVHRMPDAGLTAFSLSEDGARVAFAWRGDIYIASTFESHEPLRLTKTKAPESAPHFSPDGGRLGYLRGGELFVLDLATGATVQLTEAAGGAVAAYSWAPAGKRICIVTVAPGTRLQVLTNYSGQFPAARPFPRSVAGDDDPVSTRWLVPADGAGKPVKLEEAVRAAGLPQWSPDGTMLLGSAVELNRKRRLTLLYDANTGKSRSVFAEKDDRWVHGGFQMWSPDSKSIAVSSDADGFIHLYRIAVNGGAALQITRGAWELNTERFQIAPHWKAGRIYYSSTEAGTSERQFYSILPDGGDKQRISRGEGVRVGLASEDGTHVALLEADLRQPFDLYVDGERVTKSPRKEFAAYAWPETRFIEFPSRGDGKTVKAKLLIPAGYDPRKPQAKKLPCVFFVHGSGIASSVLRQWGSYQEQRYVFNAYLASRGYVVMDLDYRGSSGYGRDWRTGVYLHMGGPDLGDVMGAVDYLAGLGNIDMKRLGIWGVSYGGFLTNMALFQAPGVFKAGAAWAAVNDWTNYNAGYTRERLTTPAENPEAYRRSSPILFSNGLRDALLIVHGMADSNVLFQDSVQLTEKLIQEKRPFEEIFYPQEDHGFVRDESLYDAFRRTADFLERHLK